MKKKDLFEPLALIDWDERIQRAERFDDDIPLVVEEQFEYRDEEPLDKSVGWMDTTTFASSEKKLKKHVRKLEKKLADKQGELICTQLQLQDERRHTMKLQQALADEQMARNRAEIENISRQTALVISEAIRRGKGAEAFQDLAFGGTDALLTRGSWLFQGGNLDRTIPHRKPRANGYLLSDKNYRDLDSEPIIAKREDEGGGDDDDE